MEKLSTQMLICPYFWLKRRTKRSSFPHLKKCYMDKKFLLLFAFQAGYSYLHPLIPCDHFATVWLLSLSDETSMWPRMLSTYHLQKCPATSWKCFPLLVLHLHLLPELSLHLCDSAFSVFPQCSVGIGQSSTLSSYLLNAGCPYQFFFLNPKEGSNSDSTFPLKSFSHSPKPLESSLLP